MIARSKDYQLLDLAQVQAVLAEPPAAICTHPESQTTRALFDCPTVPLSPAGPLVRLLVATSPATADSPSVGEQRGEMVYELFVSTLPAPAFSAKDVLDLYLHRGSFEAVLADEDDEQDADRWVSHTAWGQECFQILAQWLWNLRLELGQHLAPAVVRTTAFAPAHAVSLAAPSEPVAPVVYGPRSGPNARLPAVFLAPLLRCNPTALCVAPLAVRSTRKNADPNTMGLCACCMLVALATAVRAHSADSVRNIPPPKNRAGSVPCFGPFPLIRSLPLPRQPCRLRPLCLRQLPSSGVIGLVALCAATGFSSCAAKLPRSPGSLFACLSLSLRMANRC